MKFSLLLVALVISIAGCVQQPQQTSTPAATTHGGEKEFRVTIFHTSYSPATITVDKGDDVHILAVAGPGTAFHNHGITIDEYGINQAVTSEDANNPLLIEFTADKQGTFTIYCKTCWDGPFGRGHPDIKATLVVK